MALKISQYNAGSIDQFIKSRVKKSGSSFYWAMRLMAPQKRKAIYAVYSFCREVDDIADGNDPAAEKRNKLLTWRKEVESIFKENPTTIIGQALLPAVNSYELVKQDFLDVLDGMEMDILENFQITDMSELELYCDRVACSVGRLSNSIFELDRKTGIKLAKSLGEALQLTNILRDVHEDYTRGKFYLPRILLNNYGMNADETVIDCNHPAVGATCRSVADIARDRYTESAIIMAKCEQNKVRPARIMMVLYRRLFEKLSDRGWYDLTSKVSLSKWEKVSLIFRSAYFE